jgi:hypothetical protein
LISFLSSSSAPGGAVIKPSDKLSYVDIKVGIPAVLLAIEMSIFAVMHIFAFSWKPYDIRHNPDPSAKYTGGPFGVKALLDAFNLWDVVKASARGFKWLFVGFKHRERDISYEDHRDNMKLGAMEPTRGSARPSGPPGPFEPASLTPTIDGRPKSLKRTDTSDSEANAALLAHQQGVPKINVREPSPYGNDPSRDHSPYPSGEQDAGPFRDPPEDAGPFRDPKPPPGNPYYIGK